MHTPSPLLALAQAAAQAASDALALLTAAVDALRARLDDIDAALDPYGPMWDEAYDDAATIIALAPKEPQ